MPGFSTLRRFILGAAVLGFAAHAAAAPAPLTLDVYNPGCCGHFPGVLSAGQR